MNLNKVLPLMLMGVLLVVALEFASGAKTKRPTRNEQPDEFSQQRIEMGDELERTDKSSRPIARLRSARSRSAPGQERESQRPQVTRSRTQKPRSTRPQTQEPSSSGNAKCALILQRTYVSRRTDNNEFYESNETSSRPAEDPQFFRVTDRSERICITYSHLNQAISEAKRRRRFTSISDDQVSSIEPRVPVIAELGELNQEITRIVSQKFNLSADEINRGLPMIDMLRTDLGPLCPLMVRPVECDPLGRFRSFTGHCNNLKNPTWGAARTPFVRFVDHQHSDGIQAERRSVLDDSQLPSPRLVTSMVHRDQDQPSGELSLLLMSWGQIIDHDVALAAPPRGKFRDTANVVNI